jgi:hypothetical protein
MGKYVCASTVSATNISIGFQPSRVVINNATDCDINTVFTKDMAAAHACDTVGDAAVTSAAVTLYTGSSTAAEGFTVGTGNTVQESAKTFSFVAFR